MAFNKKTKSHVTEGHLLKMYINCIGIFLANATFLAKANVNSSTISVFPNFPVSMVILHVLGTSQQTKKVRLLVRF